MNAQMLLQYFAGGDEEKTYIENVFSTYLRTGTSPDVTVTNGIDMTKGYMLWSKCRSTATSNILFDSARGLPFALKSDNDIPQYTDDSGLAVSNTGYTIGVSASINAGVQKYVDWCFLNAPKFFKCATVKKTAGSNATVDLSQLGTVGMVTVKRTDASGDWYTWHRSLPAGQLIYLNQTSVAATLGHITVSGTTLTLVNGVIADGTYVVYAWAHDTSPNGLIQCGNFTTDASGNATVNLGWEPQYLLIKASSATGDWMMIDSMRGMPVGGADARLYANTSGTEVSANTIDPTATGFNATSLSVNTTYIFTAIRKGPMRG